MLPDVGVHPCSQAIVASERRIKAQLLQRLHFPKLSHWLLVTYIDVGGMWDDGDDTTAEMNTSIP